MTKYLTAKKFATAPFFELYENTGPAMPPTQIPYQPEVAGPIESVRFSRDQQHMATATTYRRENVPGIGNPLTPDPGGIVVFSPEDNYVFLGGTAAAAPVLYKRVGPYYTPIPAPDWPGLDPGEYATRAVMSSNAQVIIVFTNLSGATGKVYDKTPDENSWTLKASILFGDSTAPIRITPNSLYIFQMDVLGNNRIFHLVGTAYVELTTPANRALTDYAYREDDALWVCFNGHVYSLLDGVFTLVSNNITPPLTGSPRVSGFVRFAAAGNIMHAGFIYDSLPGGAATFFAIYQWTGTTYAAFGTATIKATPTGRYPSFSTAVNATKDGMRYAVHTTAAGASPIMTLVRIFDVTGTPGSYALSQSFQWLANNSPVAAVKNFSPDGTRINVVSQSGTGVMAAQAVPPYATLDSIPELPGVTGVSNATTYYGNLGQASFTLYAGSLVPVIRDGVGKYLDVRILEGTFVSIWDRDGEVFFERNFVQHVLGTEVADMQFSPDSKVFSYHCERPDLPDQTGLGRFIYDISQQDFISFRGVIREAGDSASLIAFNATSSYCVVTFRNSTANNIKLYQFDTGYTYTLKDTQLVDFGPPAYSVCETVIVAHGGVQPYTLYAHIHDETQDRLAVLPVFVEDWDAESNILAVVFLLDCNGVVIVKEDEIVIYDPESGEELDAEPIDPPVDDDPDNPPDPEIIVDADEDDNIIIIPDPDKPDSPVFEVDGDGKTVTNIAYLPYVAINITFRTWQ